MNKNILLTLLLCCLFASWQSCSKSDDPDPCVNADLIIPGSNICLSMEHTGLSSKNRELIESKVKQGLADILKLMSIEDLRIRIVENSQLVIPEIGIGGYNPGANEVILGIDVNFSPLDSTLEKNLVSILAHEVHHAKRRRSVGYGNTLLEAVVSEGLADHFSIEISGNEPPPWTMALSSQELEAWIETAGQVWHKPYDHAKWFFGTDPGIPRWTGYNIGYELVRIYLSNNPAKKASFLHNEPAVSFKPI